MYDLALVAKWLPGEDPEDDENLAMALALEEMYWERMKVTVNQAVAALFER